jgi:single-stranded DNA-binding protein
MKWDRHERGSRVVVGRLQQRAWTAEPGTARSTVEVVAEELGPACGGRLPRRARRPGRAGPDGLPGQRRVLRRPQEPVINVTSRRCQGHRRTALPPLA